MTYQSGLGGVSERVTYSVIEVTNFVIAKRLFHIRAGSLGASFSLKIRTAPQSVSS